MKGARCPVCHRRASVDDTGRYKPHPSGSRECSGTGREVPATSKVT